MANEGYDIRELTRAIKGLTKAADNLATTLVAIERRRISEATESGMGETTEQLFGVCSKCLEHKCIPGGAANSMACSCCKTNHVQQT